MLGHLSVYETGNMGHEVTFVDDLVIELVFRRAHRGTVERYRGGNPTRMRLWSNTRHF